MKNLKHNTKKYIAGILTIALAAGVCQSYGSMEVSAHEMTLPGIEKLVQDTVASSDGTFHILEIVPSKKDASIGYLIGGEEPVSEGRKLSELPAASERLSAMAHITSSSLGNLAGSDGPVSFSDYSEGGSRTEEIRGSFVKIRMTTVSTPMCRRIRCIRCIGRGIPDRVLTDMVQSKLPGLLTRINKACPLYFLKCPVLADRTWK